MLLSFSYSNNLFKSLFKVRVAQRFLLSLRNLIRFPPSLSPKIISKTIILSAYLSDLIELQLFLFSTFSFPWTKLQLGLSQDLL